MKLTINDVIRINKEKGKHFFDPGVVRFFGSKIESELFDNLCFVTSEQDKGVTLSSLEHVAVENGERRYTVRIFDPESGEIDKVSEFMEYKTLEDALEKAKQYKK